MKDSGSKKAVFHFYVQYSTVFGESLHLIVQKDNSDEYWEKPMEYLNEKWWKITFSAEEKNEYAGSFYAYSVKDKEAVLLKEAGRRRLPFVPKHIKNVYLKDVWSSTGDIGNVFYTAPFHKVLARVKKDKYSYNTLGKYSHVFSVKAPLLNKNEVICLLGETVALKNWDTASPIVLKQNGDCWEAGIRLSGTGEAIAYKYAIFNTVEERFVRFENGDNRTVQDEVTGNTATILSDGFIHLPVNEWKAAGVAIPVFSLRSKKSFGIGEFSDIKLLADWAKQVQLSLIQLLPVNDTINTGTWEDSYPYAAISAFALHPIYINLAEVAGKEHLKVVQGFKKKQTLLNELLCVDYEEVIKTKLSILETLYELTGKDVLATKSFKGFYEENEYWLLPYAAYSYLRDKYGTANRTYWKTHQQYDVKAVKKMLGARLASAKKIRFYFFVQYHLHLQLSAAVKYAHAKGVVLKGDIPIGVHRYGVDTWTDANLFHLTEQAGAPPDDFAVAGQNWGFPTYNWQQMKEDNYSWWKKRFQQMSSYFDAFRIDHILGFFRIWSIPEHAVQGIMGRFIPCLPIHLTEFGENSIWFDEERYCEPYITNDVLTAIFGTKAAMIADNFLQVKGNGQFKLLPEYSTQRQIEAYFSGTEDTSVRDGLYSLVANVLLLLEEGSGGQQFHFRIGMPETLSYQYLDAGIKDKLYRLYINYFYERQNNFWQKEGLDKLPALKAATDMLICGEDLGMVPPAVPQVMQQLGILSLEIQRMPKAGDQRFFYPENAPYLSVVMPGTHDMSTLRAWWREDRDTTQYFFNHVLGFEGDAPVNCESWICRAILFKHLYSPAMWAIFPLQDLLAISDRLKRDDIDKERINIPAITPFYWRYRMHLPLEQLLKESEFNQELKEYIENSRRSLSAY